MSGKLSLTLGIALLYSFSAFNQSAPPRQLPAKRTAQVVKIDGLLNEPAWKDATLMTDLVEFRPTMGGREAYQNRTETYLMYDDAGIYFGGYCHEGTKDSIARELTGGRDGFGTNDYIGLILDTYNDKLNGFEYFVTPLNEQWDAKMNETITNGNSEDFSWNAVWSSGAVIHSDGWSFEMFIPYSAIRFGKKEVQNWGMNITRRRRKTEQQYTWNPIDVNVRGFLSQEGSWTGIANIKPPLRLQFSPYFSIYANHYPYNEPGQKNWTGQVNGGLDVKYGINQAFTLDMTLIPDFGQVQSDNKVLNLTPFEVKYNENRSFFTEGTELFSKGNLFYSRRIGSQPIHFYDVQDTTGSYPGHINPGENFVKNPVESKLINATKISGRTRRGLGIGVLNAITQPMYATIEDLGGKGTRKALTNPLTNYNIIVFDQTLKNNSALSFVNTSVLRSGSDYDANVSAAVFNFNNKKNTYNWNGKVALSQLFSQGQTTLGYSHNINFGKTGGNWNFQVAEDLTDRKYDINDMGILFNNNYIDHSLWTAYKWVKPGKWYNRVQINYNAYYSMLYERVPGQKINSNFQGFSTNINGNVQFKNLWFAGMFIGFVTKGNDFYEPRTTGYSFKTPSRIQFNPWFETSESKKYYFNLNYFVGIRKWDLFTSPNHEIDLLHRYRFSDKISITHSLVYNPTTNDAGYYYPADVNGNFISVNDILFTRRDRKTIENVLSFKYSFSNKSGFTIRIRHYWSKVKQQQLYDLKDDGSISPSVHINEVPLIDQNFNIFNVDAVYSWQFAPGSFVNIVWKDQGSLFDNSVEYRYFKNFERTLDAPQNNNLSLKIIYFLDYLDFKKGKNKKKNVN